MLKIYSRNIDEITVYHEFESPQAFLDDWKSEDCSMGDNEILLVVWNGFMMYSSLGRKGERYEDTVRTDDVIKWFSEEQEDDGGDVQILKAVQNMPQPEKRLPNGSTLVVLECADTDFPGLRIVLQRPGEPDECLCFAEINAYKPAGKQLCIGAYSRGMDDPAYYESYNDPASPSPNN